MIFRWFRARATMALAPLPAVLLLAVTGCGTSDPGSALSRPETMRYFPGIRDDRPGTDYRIGAFDLINITVFRSKDLSLDNVQVDASGRILFPLIGSVMAAGRTTAELSKDIADRLSTKYLQNPQVSVVVAESVTQKVTVEGSVVEAGVYELKGQTTLLQAVAMAKGPSPVAKLGRVAVFRRIDGRRAAAVFDIDAIRRGAMDDPEILGNDVVVVGISNVKGVFREVLSTLPALAVFRYF